MGRKSRKRRKAERRARQRDVAKPDSVAAGAGETSPSTAAKTNARPQPASAAHNAAGDLREDDVQQVHRLLERGRTKAAIKRAKALHKDAQTPASESVLVHAYGQRIREFVVQGRRSEAEDLWETVVERHSSAREQLAGLWEKAHVAAGDLTPLLASLATPSLPDAERARIHDTLARELTNPATLAKSDALPADHPLRTAARAVQQALEAVTSGPVDPETIALPQVSSKSPLAPWKWLIHAIAAFYRQEDDRCRRLLDRVPADTAPARLAPALHAMMDQGRDARPPEPARDLVRRVLGSRETLAKELVDVERALVRRSRPRAFQAIRQAVSACERAAPDRVDRLCQHIAVRAEQVGLRTAEVRKHMGRPVRKHAYFWRLYARAMEAKAQDHGELHSLFMACAGWEEFCRAAVHEGWFPSAGPETAAVYLHIADELTDVPEELLEEARPAFQRDLASKGGLAASYRDQPPEIRAHAAPADAGIDFLYPEKLFERACRADPRAESFQRWLAWEEERGSATNTVEAVAQAWHEASPQDIRPLLWLMDRAEARGALHKARKRLEQAESIDRINTAVRQARIRLETAIARRHLHQGKAHLARKDLHAIQALDGVDPEAKDRMCAALAWCVATIEDDAEATRRLCDRLAEPRGRATGAPPGDAQEHQALAVHVLLRALGHTCGLPEDRVCRLLPPPPAVFAQGALPCAVARALDTGARLQMHLALVPEWAERLEDDLRASDCGLETTALLLVADAAMAAGMQRAAYFAAGRVLARDARQPRALLVRAKSLPDFARERRIACLQTCVFLARQTRDDALVEEAAAVVRPRRRSKYANMFALYLRRRILRPLEEERVQEILDIEAGERDYPTLATYQDGPYGAAFREEEPCDCPACRRARGEAVDDDEFWDEEDDDEEEWDDEPDVPTGTLAWMLERFMEMSAGR